MQKERGAAPSSVSVAVLCVEGLGLLLAMPLFGVVPEARTVLVLPLVLPALVLVSSVVTAVCVLPSVVLGHWLGRRGENGERWWWVAAAAGPGVLPAVGLSLAAVAVYGQGGVLGSRQDALGRLLYAAVLYAVSVPAALAAHATILRADAGRPVRPVGRVLGYGALVLVTELVGVLVVLAALE